MQYTIAQRSHTCEIRMDCYDDQNQRKDRPVKPLFNADDFSKKVRIRIAERGIDMRTAATEIGCSHATVSRICGGKSPDVENYLRIGRWLDRVARA